jgi:hypothetical protein
MSSSAQIGCCERCCTHLQTFTLQTFNLLDFILGWGFVALGFYVCHEMGVQSYTNDKIAWVALACMIVGGLMVFVVFLSFVAITNVGCRCLSYPSGFFALMISIITLAVGIAACVREKDIYKYINEHAVEDGIPQDQVQLFKSFYQIIKYSMFALCVEQFVRFRASMTYRSAALRLDGEYDALLDEDQKKWNERVEYNRVNRQEKYSDLRSHYKDKYSTNNV